MKVIFSEYDQSQREAFKQVLADAGWVIDDISIISKQALLKKVTVEEIAGVVIADYGSSKHRFTFQEVIDLHQMLPQLKILYLLKARNAYTEDELLTLYRKHVYGCLFLEDSFPEEAGRLYLHERTEEEAGLYFGLSESSLQEPLIPGQVFANLNHYIKSGRDKDELIGRFHDKLQIFDPAHQAYYCQHVQDPVILQAIRDDPLYLSYVTPEPEPRRFHPFFRKRKREDLADIEEEAMPDRSAPVEEEQEVMEESSLIEPPPEKADPPSINMALFTPKKRKKEDLWDLLDSGIEAAEQMIEAEEVSEVPEETEERLNEPDLMEEPFVIPSEPEGREEAVVFLKPKWKTVVLLILLPVLLLLLFLILLRLPKTGKKEQMAFPEFASMKAGITFDLTTTEQVTEPEMTEELTEETETTEEVTETVTDTERQTTETTRQPTEATTEVATVAEQVTEAPVTEADPPVTVTEAPVATTEVQEDISRFDGTAVTGAEVLSAIRQYGGSYGIVVETREHGTLSFGLYGRDDPSLLSAEATYYSSVSFVNGKGVAIRFVQA